MTICPGSKAKDTSSTAGRSAPSKCTERWATSSAYMQSTPAYETEGTRDAPGSRGAFGSRDQHPIGGQSIVCTLIRIIDEGPMLDHNIVKSHVCQELTYGFRTVQPFRIGAIPQHTRGFG